jgi:hypothetical protein
MYSTLIISLIINVLSQNIIHIDDLSLQPSNFINNLHLNMSTISNIKCPINGYSDKLISEDKISLISNNSLINSIVPNLTINHPDNAKYSMLKSDNTNNIYNNNLFKNETNSMIRCIYKNKGIIPFNNTENIKLYKSIPIGSNLNLLILDDQKGIHVAKFYNLKILEVQNIDSYTNSSINTSELTFLNIIYNDNYIFTISWNIINIYKIKGENIEYINKIQNDELKIPLDLIISIHVFNNIRTIFLAINYDETHGIVKLNYIGRKWEKTVFNVYDEIGHNLVKLNLIDCKFTKFYAFAVVKNYGIITFKLYEEMFSDYVIKHPFIVKVENILSGDGHNYLGIFFNNKEVSEFLLELVYKNDLNFEINKIFLSKDKNINKQILTYELEKISYITSNDHLYVINHAVPSIINTFNSRLDLNSISYSDKINLLNDNRSILAFGNNTINLFKFNRDENTEVMCELNKSGDYQLSVRYFMFMGIYDINLCEREDIYNFVVLKQPQSLWLVYTLLIILAIIVIALGVLYYLRSKKKIRKNTGGPLLI